jgi:hypothetical protein
MADIVKLRHRCFNLVIDPGRGAIRRFSRTQRDDIAKGTVKRRFKPTGFKRFGK